MTLESCIEALAQAEMEISRRDLEVVEPLPELSIDERTAPELRRGDVIDSQVGAGAKLHLGLSKIQNKKTSKEKSVKERSSKSKASKKNEKKTDEKATAPPSSESGFSRTGLREKKNKKTRIDKKAVESSIKVRLEKLTEVLSGADQKSAERAGFAEQDSQHDPNGNKGLIEQFFIRVKQGNDSESVANRVARAAARNNTVDPTFIRQIYTPYPGNDYQVLKQRLVALSAWRERVAQERRALRRRFALRVIQPTPTDGVVAQQLRLTKPLVRWFGVVRNDAIVAEHIKTYQDSNSQITYQTGSPTYGKPQSTANSSSKYKHLREIYGHCV